MADHVEHPHDRINVQPDAGALLARTPAVIAPGHTFRTVTEAISHTVLSKRTPLGWFLGFGVAFVLLLVLNVTCLLYTSPSPRD